MKKELKEETLEEVGGGRSISPKINVVICTKCGSTVNTKTTPYTCPKCGELSCINIIFWRIIQKC